MKQFKIVSLRLFDVGEFEKFTNVEFDFSEFEDKIADFPFVTLVIGANTTGKSRLLRILLDIFNDLYNLKNEGKDSFAFKGGYNLTYQNEGKLFEITNGRPELIVLRDGKKINVKKLNLPNRIIAIASSIADRFPQQISISPSQLRPSTSRYNNSFYEYLGIRTFNNMASSTGHITRMLDIISNATINGNLNPSILKVFNFLNLEPRISIEYKIRGYSSSLLERNKLSETYLKEFIKKLDERKAGFAFKYFQALLVEPEKIKEVVDFFDQMKSRGGTRKMPLIFDLDFSDKTSLDNFFREYRMFDLLRKLNLIGYGTISVYRNGGTRFNLNKGSSGEIHLMTSLISLGCVIEDNSLILIDEPEISLHPNWQMKYLDLVNSIFENQFSNCHFIISTHSHFLVSDLRPNTSFVLILKHDEEFKLIAKPLERQTFGWSAEEVLYTVFNVRSTRNSFLEYDLTKLVTLINRNSKEFEEIKRINEKIKSLVLSEGDPLRILVEKAENYLAQNNA